MPTASPDAVLTDLVDGVARDGYAIAPAFLPTATIEALRLRALALDEGGALAPAGIGRAGKHRLATDIRGDRIAWLGDTPGSPAEAAARRALEQLRVAVNRGLMMGLERLRRITRSIRRRHAMRGTSTGSATTTHGSCPACST